MFLRHLLGRTAFYAPEDDRGAAEEPDLDLDQEDDPPEDDPEDEDAEEPDEDQDDEASGEGDDPPPKKSREEGRVATLARETKEAKAQTAKLENEMAALRLQVQQNQAPRETQDQFNARIAQMEPWERTEYLRQLDSQATNAKLTKIEFDAWDRGDKLSYDALANREPIAAKLKDDVEKLVLERRAAGQNVDRETVLKFLIGERALANKGRATGKAQRTATANRDRQTARPGNGRADAQTGDRRGGNDAAARAKRLADIEI